MAASRARCTSRVALAADDRNTTGGDGPAARTSRSALRLTTETRPTNDNLGERENGKLFIVGETGRWATRCAFAHGRSVRRPSPGNRSAAVLGMSRLDLRPFGGVELEVNRPRIVSMVVIHSRAVKRRQRHDRLSGVVSPGDGRMPHIAAVRVVRSHAGGELPSAIRFELDCCSIQFAVAFGDVGERQRGYRRGRQSRSRHRRCVRPRGARDKVSPGVRSHPCTTNVYGPTPSGRQNQAVPLVSICCALAATVVPADQRTL